MKREAALGELHSLQIAQGTCARLLHCAPAVVSQMASRLGLKFSKAWSNGYHTGDANKVKVERMAALYRAGYTLEQIGQQYGVSRERIRQLLKKLKGMNQFDGGMRVKAERTRAAKRQAKDASQLAKHGCTHDQWQELRRIGEEMMRQGKGLYQTPLRAFSNQRNNAIRRGVGWELTLWQWWCIWQSSGHWEQRGRGDGYVMCRKGDDGPYAADNVFIGTGAQNSWEGQVKYHHLSGELPMGVRRTTSGRYMALRRKQHLGTYDTIEEAHAAYLIGSPTVARVTRRRHNLPSGVRPVGRRFNAYFYVGKKQFHLGTFDTVEQAHAAHLAAKSAQMAVAA